MTGLDILILNVFVFCIGCLFGGWLERRKRVKYSVQIKTMRSEKGGCLRQAVATGLAYMGRYDDVSYIPDSASADDLRQICKRFNLTLIEGIGTYSYSGLSPVLSVYAVDDAFTEEGRPVQHAVFASDGRVFEQLPVSMTVIGWDGNHSYTRTNQPVAAGEGEGGR